MSSIIPVSIVIFYRNITRSTLDLWVQQRKEVGPLNNLWEFPGGKIEASESPLNAAKREVFEEVGFNIDEDLELNFLKFHPYPQRKKTITLYVYSCQLREAQTQLESKGKWITLKFKEKSHSLKGFIPPVNHVIIDEFLEDLKHGNY